MHPGASFFQRVKPLLDIAQKKLGTDPGQEAINMYAQSLDTDYDAWAGQQKTQRAKCISGFVQNMERQT
jgi:hypothetical protein